MKMLMALALFLSALAAQAQVTNDAFGEFFDDLTLAEALDESIAHSKLLVIYVDQTSLTGTETDRSKARLAAARRDRLLRFWVRQHAILIPLGVEHRELALQIIEAANARCTRAGGEGLTYASLPVLGIFVSGEIFSAVSACRLNQNAIHGGGIFDRGEAHFANKVGAAMTWATFELDFQLDRIKALNPVWFGLHELRNPPLEAEARVYFSEIEDGNADRFDDGLVEDPKDVLGAITLARTQADLGDRFGSASTYTWLWEKGANRDPDYGPAIRTLVTADVQELVHRWENFETRFNDMKADATGRIGLESLDEFGDWVRLAAVTGDPLVLLRELDYRINSDYFGSLMPRDERRVLLMIAETETEIMERLFLPDEQLAQFNRLLKNYESEQSDLAKPELRRLALDRAVLLHARLLEEGLETDARQVARQAIERIGPESRPALIAGALVVRQTRPWHTDFLPNDGSSRRLAGHLQMALEDARMPESDELRTIRIGE